jgi:ABC-type lipoprotein export system ATPase subunit
MRLTMEGLGHSFHPPRMLFTALDATIEAGEMVAVTGPSGAGKSTFLSLVAGWLDPSEGTISRQGVDKTSWVFQNPHGVPGRTALDHVTLPLLAAGLRRAEADGRGQGIMAQFGLTELADQPFRHLSGGESQRLMLARAVATNPDLLLVDEPTAQLDRSTAATVNAVLTNLVSKDKIVLIATHDPDTRAACARVLDLGALSAPPSP